MFKRLLTLAAVALAVTAICLVPPRSVWVSHAADPAPAADPDTGLDDTGAGTLDQSDTGAPVDETDAPAPAPSPAPSPSPSPSPAPTPDPDAGLDDTGAGTL